MHWLILMGALLAAAPMTDPRLQDGKLLWFDLNESPEGITKALGRPANEADFGDFRALQFKIDVADTHDFSHEVVFRRSSNTVVSIARNYEPERNVDALFPPAETTVHHFPDAIKPQFSMRVRRLSGGRVLIAMGSPEPGRTTGQLLLIKEAEISYFYPWLHAQLNAR